jgi:hypothetical protein
MLWSFTVSGTSPPSGDREFYESGNQSCGNTASAFRLDSQAGGEAVSQITKIGHPHSRRLTISGERRRVLDLFAGRQGTGQRSVELLRMTMDWW